LIRTNELQTKPSDAYLDLDGTRFDVHREQVNKEVGAVT